MFLKVINLILFIQVCNLVHYVISHYVNKSKNKLILELSELRVEMLSTMDMEMGGLGNLVLCAPFRSDLLSALSGQKKEVGFSKTAVHIQQSRRRCISEDNSHVRR